LPVPFIMRIVSTLILQAALAAAILAQPAPQVNSVVSAASYWNPIMKNSLLAAGSLVVIFGTNLGPAALTQASAFPIPTTLAGTSVAIIGAPQGATQAYMIYTSANQVAVILPSNLALQATRGVADYTIAVSYNGIRSNPYTIQQREQHMATKHKVVTQAEWLKARTRLLGFYSHVDAEVRERAERAGFDLVVPRSRMAREGAALVAALAGS